MSLGKFIRWMRQLALLMFSASMSMHSGAATKFDPLDPLGTVRKNHAAKQKGIILEVAPGDWGGADIRDIKRVLDSVASTLLTYIGPVDDSIRISVIPRSGSPRVRYERGPEDQYMVQLTARDQRWFQYVFQFSHELCHVLSNFDHKERIGDGDQVDEKNQWFEESLCETASLFTLRKLAKEWERTPPTRNWVGYGKILSDYATRLISEPHRRLPAGKSLAEWYAENMSTLSENPYQREKNELVATTLLPLFEARPELWQSIRYLNQNPESAGKPFAGYVADWSSATPDKALPDQVAELFGFTYGDFAKGQATTVASYPDIN